MMLPEHPYSLQIFEIKSSKVLHDYFNFLFIIRMFFLNATQNQSRILKAVSKHVHTFDYTI